MSKGSFIVSLDFELYWGVRDVVSLAQTKDHFLRARDAIPEMLRCFEEHGVHATWATVGFLFAKSKRHLFEHLPSERPRYRNPRFDPYPALDRLGDDERTDPFHYAHSLLMKIAETPGQEIGSHTFSHFYCLEAGQTEGAFEQDLQAAAAIGAQFGAVTESLVFPRGQHNPAYRTVLEHQGVRAYRVPSSFYPYRPCRAGSETRARRALRLLDSYLPLGTASTEPLGSMGSSRARAIRSGLFLRPYAPSRRRLESLRLIRLKRAMGEAALRDRDFHLWWHPHNFGTYTRENLAVLGDVLGEYRGLRERHGWASRTMGGVARAADAA